MCQRDSNRRLDRTCERERQGMRDHSVVTSRVTLAFHAYRTVVASNGQHPKIRNSLFISFFFKMSCALKTLSVFIFKFDKIILRWMDTFHTFYIYRGSKSLICFCFLF